MSELRNELIRIAVFYDGNYFYHVSNYYNYQHERKARISIGGLHNFIRNKVAQEEGVGLKHCQVVDSHYFRGRLSAYEARDNSNKLFYERVFDDILMAEGVVTHYLPLKSRDGVREEKGIDVWLALEAYELAIHKEFDVVVLIAADGDYVPLIRKLNTLRTRVMVLSWDFSYTDDYGRNMHTRTSQDLLEEVTYPIAMHELIDNRLKKHDPLVNNLFVSKYGSGTNNYPNHSNGYNNSNHNHHSTNNYAQSSAGSNGNGYNGGGKTKRGRILSIVQDYGFIEKPPHNVSFNELDMVGGEFERLKKGDLVEYVLHRNDRNEWTATNVRKIDNTTSQHVDHQEH